MTGMKKRLMLISGAVLLLLIICTVTLSVYADQSSPSENVTVTVNYYIYNEDSENAEPERPFPAFTASMPRGSSPIIKKCPYLEGYTPCDAQGHQTADTEIVFSADAVIEIYYHPAEVTYTIRLMKQDLTCTGYEPADTVYCHGLTDTVPKELADGFTFGSDESIPESLHGRTLENAYEGFTLISCPGDNISADGMKEYVCYYDRDFFEVDFILGEGGQGVDPVYAPYGSPLSVNDPTRPCFVFRGWAEKNSDPEHIYTLGEVTALPDIITQDTAYVAVWEQDRPVGYSIVYCREVLPDGSGTEKYEYWTKLERNVEIGGSLYLDYDEVIAEYSGIASLILNDGALEGALEDHRYFVFNSTLTGQKNKKVNNRIKISCDGSTVITLYYSRRSYELKFVYARKVHGAPAYPEVTSVEPYTADAPETYYIVHNNSRYHGRRSLTAETTVYRNAAGLRMLDLDNEDQSAITAWRFEPVRDENGQIKTDTYYISPVCDPTKYLCIENGDASLGQQVAALREMTPQNRQSLETKLIFSGNKCFIKSAGKDYYLNDKSDGGCCATAYKQNNSGSEWRIYSDKEMTAVNDRYEITNTTLNGHDPGVSGRRMTDWWGVRVDELPAVTLPEVPDGRPWLTCEAKQEERTFAGSEEKYTYYYISVTAPYEADIEAVWPVLPFEPVTGVSDDQGTKEYRFGSWGTGEGSAYRLAHSTDNRANIIGAYPYMSSELLREGHEDEPLAMMLYAWWGDSTAEIGEHTFRISFEKADEDGFEVPEDITFACAYNNTTYIFPFAYRGFEIIGDHSSGLHTKENGIKHTESSYQYRRRRYTLTFRNYNETIAEIPEVRYGAAIEGIVSRYMNVSPPADSGIDQEHFTFTGWYSSEYFDKQLLIRGLSDETACTMPDHDMILYACWKPNTYTVEYYNDEGDLRSEKPCLFSSTHCYREYIGEDEIQSVSSLLSPPGYTDANGAVRQAGFIGWFRLDGQGTLRCFKPDSMRVPGELRLFARWSPKIPAADYDRGDLTVCSEGCLTDGQNMTQCFGYRVRGTDEHNRGIDICVIIQNNGEKTIKGLPTGHYEVSPAGWAWRYSTAAPDGQASSVQNVTIEKGRGKTVCFYRTMTNRRWLDGNALLDNTFCSRNT